jgi:hypothetical protein
MLARRSAAPRPVRQPCRRCRCRLGVRKTMGIRGILLTSYQHPAIIPPGRRGRPAADVAQPRGPWKGAAWTSSQLFAVPVVSPGSNQWRPASSSLARSGSCCPGWSSPPRGDVRGGDVDASPPPRYRQRAGNYDGSWSPAPCGARVDPSFDPRVHHRAKAPLVRTAKGMWGWRATLVGSCVDRR